MVGDQEENGEGAQKQEVKERRGDSTQKGSTAVEK